MPENIKLKEASVLVQTVVALDEHFSSLERIGQKIQETELRTEFDIQQARKLLALFAEHGQQISENVVKLSQELNATRERAALVSDQVALKTEELSGRDNEQNLKMEEFRMLAEKVGGINAKIAHLRPVEGAVVTDDDRKRIYASLVDFDTEIEPLILQAQTMRNEAHASKMKVLEQNADSLAQTLIAVRQKVRGLGANFPVN